MIEELLSSETGKLLATFLISMLPVIELRGAIPVGVGLGIPVWQCFIMSVIGNFLPVPFILIFIRRLLRWMKGRKYLGKFADWLEEKASKNSKKLLKYSAIGLFFFVSVPFPGTGAWTGALVAAFLDMRFKYSLPAIFCGVVAAGIIVSLICTGVLGALSFML